MGIRTLRLTSSLGAGEGTIRPPGKAPGEEVEREGKGLERNRAE